jgi:uncharacterized protein
VTREDHQRPDSPCTNLCVIDPDTGWCKGCARTLDEIARWADMSPEEQWDVVRAIRARRGEVEPHDA